MKDTPETETGAVGLVTSAACDVVVTEQSGGMSTVHMSASVSFDKDVKARLDKAASVLKEDKDVAMHGIEVRYDCNSFTATDTCEDGGSRLAVSRLRVERTYYNGKPCISVLFDAVHSIHSPIRAVHDHIPPSETPERFTYIVQYTK